MQKLIAIPMARYTNLVAKEQSRSGLKETVKAMTENQETQDLLQRRRHYEYANEKMPESFNKKIDQTAITYLPPPASKIHALRAKRDVELEAFYGQKSRKNKACTIRKPVIKKETKPKAVKVQVVAQQKPKFNLLDPKIFHRSKQNK